MSDETMEAAFTAGCNAGHPLNSNGGSGNRSQITIHLGLEKAREARARGVILPPFLRLFLYGRSMRCKDYDPVKARELAKPEVWVVIWRYEDPPHPYSSGTTSKQKVLHPTQVRHFSKNSFHQPLHTRTRDRWAKDWFAEDWNEKESLLVAFASLDRTGALHVDYKVEENGRSYLRESTVFPLHFLPEIEWDAAFGGAL